MKPVKKIVGTTIGLVICCIVLTSVVCVPGTNSSLFYGGQYVDLLEQEKNSAPLQTSETRVTFVDTNTGLPAAVEMSMVRFAGESEHRVNVVRFNYNGTPAMLRFTNDVADGLAYQDQIADFWCKPGAIWEADPNILKDALDDYAAQVEAIKTT